MLKVQNIVIVGGLVALFLLIMTCGLFRKPKQTEVMALLRAMPSTSLMLWQIPHVDSSINITANNLTSIPLGGAQIHQDLVSLQDLWKQYSPSQIWAAQQSRGAKQSDFLYLFPLTNAADTATIYAHFRRTGSLKKSQFRDYPIHHWSDASSATSWAFTYAEPLLLLAPLPLHVEAAIDQLHQPASTWSNEFAELHLASLVEAKTPQLYFGLEKWPSQWLGLLRTEQEELMDLRKQKKLWTRWQYRKDSLGLYWQGQVAGLKQSKTITPRVGNPHALADLLPSTTIFYHWYTAGTLNYQAAKDEGEEVKRYFLPHGVDEIAWGQQENSGAWEDGQWAMLKMKDAASAQKAIRQYLEEKGELESLEYQSFTIHRVLDGKPLAALLGQEVSELKDPYLLVLNDWLLFANARATLEFWIDAYLTGNTLARQATYQKWQNEAADQVAAQYFVQIPLWETWRQQGGGARQEEDYFTQNRKEWQVLAIQSQPVVGGQVKMEARLLKGKTTQEATRLLWKKELTHTLRGGPQPFYNPRRGNYEILAQDTRHRLYLLDLGGQLLWQRPFEEAILSPISTIDYFQNGEVQFAFNTAHHIYLLDDRGRDVGVFPLDLQVPAIHGMKLVDFQQRGEYAFFVPSAQGAVYGLAQDGSPIPGWNPLVGQGQIVQAVEHCVFQKRDYLLVASAGGKLRAFARDATPRFEVANLGAAPNNPLQIEQDADRLRILVPRAEGNLAVVNHLGEWFPLPFPAAERQVFGMANILGDKQMEYWGWSGEEAVVYHYTPEGDFQKAQDYQWPEAPDSLFVVSLPEVDQAALGTFQRSSSQIKLYDGQGKLFPGFPLAGTSSFRVVGAQQRSILVVANGAWVYAYQLRGREW